MPNKYATPTGAERWNAFWRDANGKQHNKTFELEEDARAYEVEMIAVREADLGPQICQWPDCGQVVEQNMVDGKLTGKRIRYHLECAKLAKNDSAMRSKRNSRSRQKKVREEEPPEISVCPECGVLFEQSRDAGSWRRFHGDPCRLAFWNRSDRPPPTARRSVTEVDEEQRIGTCSYHGRVRVWRISDKYADGRPRVRWKCKDCDKKSSAESRERYQRSDKGRFTKFCHRYGITREQGMAALAMKTDECDICKRDDQELVYDHCHDTNEHRGWVCHQHNLGLGNFSHDPVLLRAAAVYLERAPWTK